MSEMSPYQKGFTAAEDNDPRGRRANPFEYKSGDWWQWEYGYSDYASARAEMYEDDCSFGNEEDE